MRRMRAALPAMALLVGLAMGAVLTGSVARATVIVVPNSLTTVEGILSNDFPLHIANAGLSSQRYQQVFAAAEFRSLLEPQLITHIAFRPDAQLGHAFAPTISSLQINLSTTSAAPDKLSPTFATNVGPDDTVVFSGSLALSSAFTGPAAGPKDFDMVIELQTPFLYDPAAGNLLLDLTNVSGGLATWLDAQFFSGDAVSRTATHLAGGDSPTANFSDTIGVVTQFTTSVVHRAPIANAGADQAVHEGLQVTVDGTGSSDPDGNALTYQWQQLAGPPVALSSLTVVQPTFVAPEVSSGGTTLTFQLIVSDGQLSSAPDTVDITVKNVNHPPVAEAEAVSPVQEESLVTLDGSASFDADGDALTYAWSQTAGPAVTLVDPTTAQPAFLAPLLGSAGATLTFQLTVSDGLASASETVDVVVEHVNHPPTAKAGEDQTKDEGRRVQLNGTASSDPDGDLLLFTWTQRAGPAVTLSDASSPTPTFTTHAVGAGGATLVFELVVHDGELTSPPDEVRITVVSSADPPRCDLAQATPALLWPPTHNLVLVTVEGVTDPDNDAVTLTVTRVTQDEPVSGMGDGDTSPDAVRQGSAVLLRAEHAGAGNDRVYHVDFMAEDSTGRRCMGTVTVCVPFNRQHDMCIDNGSLYDST
jgi:K319L-like, PKD domain